MGSLIPGLSVVGFFRFRQSLTFRALNCSFPFVLSLKSLISTFCSPPASYYEVAVSTNFSELVTNFSSAIPLRPSSIMPTYGDSSLSKPRKPGEFERIHVHFNLSHYNLFNNKSVYIAVRAVDDAGNAGSTSSVLQLTTAERPDTTQHDQSKPLIHQLWFQVSVLGGTALVSAIVTILIARRIHRRRRAELLGKKSIARASHSWTNSLAEDTINSRTACVGFQTEI